MNTYYSVKLGVLYRSFFVRAIRFLIFFSLCMEIGINLQGGKVVFPWIGIFFIFCIIEIFFRYKIENVIPQISISSVKADELYRSSTRVLLEKMVSARNGKDLILGLFKLPQGNFFLQKIGITNVAEQVVDVPVQNLLDKAVEITKAVSGQFLTSSDVLGAYFVLTENQTHILLQRQLRVEDVPSIVLWCRLHSSEEIIKKTGVSYGGFCLGDSLLTGWTPEVKKYTTYVPFLPKYTIPVLSGREQIYKEIVNTLSQQENNNVLLVGEPGVGKKFLIRLLTEDGLKGKLPDKLNHRQILELLVGELVAGATAQGSLEERMQAIIDEVSHAGNVLLYISNLQDLLGASNQSLNVTGMLFPYLRDGKLPIIASITPDAYTAYIEKNPIAETFAVLRITEPAVEDARRMLFGRSESIEYQTGALISYEALQAALDFGSTYQPLKRFPGNAVQLLADCAHTVSHSDKPLFDNTKKRLVEKKDIADFIEEKVHVPVGDPSTKEKDLLLHIEDRLHQQVIGQNEAITQIAEALRRVRTGFSFGKKPVSFLFLGPTGVGKTETAKALAILYFGGENHMLRFDMSEYVDETGIHRLLGAGPGEGQEWGELTEKIFDNPFSLVLLDEFEKANPHILDLFLQVFDDGRLTDSKGKTVSFANAFVIATSNAASEFIREAVVRGTKIDKAFYQQLLTYLQEQHNFKPELLNRFDAVVVFTPLGKEEIQQIISLLLTQVTKNLAKQNITVSFDELVREKILKDGFDIQFGARPLRRYIQDSIEDMLAKKILQGEIKAGSNVIVSVGPDGVIMCK